MRAPNELVGRESELEILHDVLEATENGHGGLVAIEGESGVGKTCLVERSLCDSGLRTIRSRPVGQSAEPYAALRAFQDKVAPPPHTTRPEEFRREFEAWLSRACRKGLLALFLDDAQWADSPSLECLPLLMPFLETHPVLMLLAYRSEEVTADHAIRRLRTRLRRERSVTELALSTLSESDVSHLMTQKLGSPPSPELTRQVFEGTNGLPLFVEELCATLESEERLTPTPKGLRLPDTESMPLPETIRDLASLQLTALSGPAREALEGAAVAGNDFEMGLLLRLGFHEHAVDELLERRLLAERGGCGFFRHSLLREALLDEIPWSRRRKLNDRLADLLAKGGAQRRVLAEHLLAAGREEEACEMLLAAAEDACAANAFRDATSLFERALAVWPEMKPEEERLASLERMARCAESGGCLKDAARSWRELIGSPNLRATPRKLADAYCNLATVHELMGAEAPAAEARAAAIQTFEEAGLVEEAASTALAQAESAIVRSRLSSGKRIAEKALELAKLAENLDLESRALSAIGLAFSMEGRKTAARRRIEAALEMALEHGLKGAAAVAYQRMTYVFAYVADFKGQRDAFGTAIGFCRREGLDSERVACMGCMSYALFRLGEWKRAAAVCREIIETNEPDDVGRVIAESVLGFLYAARGQIRQARRTLEKADADARRHGIVPIELITRPALAWTDEQVGDDAGAAVRYRELLGFRRQTEDTFDVLPGVRLAAMFFGRTRMAPELGACADAARKLASLNRNPEGLGTVSFVLGECALLNGQAAEAARQFLVAKGEFAKMEARYDMAQAAERAGAAHRKSGATTSSIEELRESHRIAKTLGARPLLRAAERELAAAGVTPGEERATPGRSRASQTGLTRRQMEVAKLVAEGLTNKEVAQRLHLSPRTVDMHVAAVLDRLDCRTRSEATRKLVDLGLVD